MHAALREDSNLSMQVSRVINFPPTAALVISHGFILG